jgi:hypothetical protein
MKDFLQWFLAPAQFSMPFVWFVYIMGLLTGWVIGTSIKLSRKESEKINRRFWDTKRDLDAVLKTIELKKESANSTMV